jgi:hypothetical protein
MDEEQSIKMDYIKFRKIMFINNAIEQGWTIKKDKDAYIFSKKHEGKKEIYLDNYLKKFLCDNMKAELCSD